jgi:hypothetical protein
MSMSIWVCTASTSLFLLSSCCIIITMVEFLTCLVFVGMLATTLARHRSKPRVYIGCMKSGPVLSRM